jgi:hypothetical protein
MAQVICKRTFPDDEPDRIRSTAFVLARYHAKQAVKEQWRAQGRKLQDLNCRELNRATEAYLSQHREELIAKACASLRIFALQPKP